MRTLKAPIQLVLPNTPNLLPLVALVGFIVAIVGLPLYLALGSERKQP